MDASLELLQKMVGNRGNVKAHSQRNGWQIYYTKTKGGQQFYDAFPPAGGSRLTARTLSGIKASIDEAIV